jgi:hypothetical protein
MRCQQCEETATNSSAMAGLLVSQPNQNTKSQTLSPHEDHYPGKIRIKIPARKPLKRQKKKKQKPEKERINLKNQNHKIEKKEKTTEQKGSQKKRVESQLLPRIPVTSTSRVFVQNASTR